MSRSSIAVIKWRQRTKQRVVAAFGDCCGICGYNKCTASLAVHHLVPAEKKFSFSDVRASTKNWADIVIELRKCVLLCHNCHSEFHNGITNIPIDIRKFDENYSTYSLRDFRVNLCLICDKECTNKYCSPSCATKARSKVKWINIDLLEELKTQTLEEIGVKYNCSTSAVWKRKRRIMKLSGVV